MVGQQGEGQLIVEDGQYLKTALAIRGLKRIDSLRFEEIGKFDFSGLSQVEARPLPVPHWVELRGLLRISSAWRG